MTTNARAEQRALDEREVEALTRREATEGANARTLNERLSERVKELCVDARARSRGERTAYACEVRRSTCEDATSGLGLFARGARTRGDVVAQYPGLTYVGRAVRYMKNYPRVSDGNEYLIARSDGSVIDAKGWGRYFGDEDASWPGAPVDLSDEEKRAGESTSFLGRLLRPRLSEGRRMRLLEECRAIERRNAYAYAHVANHPPAGTKPNVVVASVDVVVDGLDADLRRFIPNVNVEDDDDDGMDKERLLSILSDRTRSMSKRFSDAALAMFGEDEDKPRSVRETSRSAIRALVLIATRDIEDGEEIWLNYRLSPHVKPPSWYVRVDAEEDARRWAPET